MINIYDMQQDCITVGTAFWTRNGYAIDWNDDEFEGAVVISGTRERPEVYVTSGEMFRRLGFELWVNLAPKQAKAGGQLTEY